MFEFRPFSAKQRKVMDWWLAEPLKEYNGIIADGAIRSGKTLSMSLSYVMWAMHTFDDRNFGICGKTQGSLRRNVLVPLKTMLLSRGYAVEENRGLNLWYVRRGRVTNTFYMFSGSDESSQDLVQGITLAGVFFDEVALMPESFVNQATARCSIAGSKWWFNCNPQSPFHWFKQHWIDEADERKLVYLHFRLEDNLSLAEEIRDRYYHMYQGVFFKRYVLGQWVAAEGVIYDMFSHEKHIVRMADIADRLTGTCYVSCDYGTQNATVFKMWTKGTDGIWYNVREYYYSGRDQMKQKTDADYVEDMKKFVGDDHPRSIIVDPSAASFIEALRRAGFNVMRADNAVLDGIRTVSRCLAQEKIKYVETCENTFKEYGSYRWDPKAAAKGEDVPIKEQDHAMDADRYFVKTVLGGKVAKIGNKKKRGFY